MTRHPFGPAGTAAVITATGRAEVITSPAATGDRCPPCPPGTATLAPGTGGEIDALAVHRATLTIWQLARRRQHLDEDAGDQRADPVRLLRLSRPAGVMSGRCNSHELRDAAPPGTAGRTLAARARALGQDDLLGPEGGMYGYTENKDAYIKRLRRIEGQVRGLQRMVEDDKYCIDILTQVAAATRALQSVAHRPAGGAPGPLRRRRGRRRR